MLSLQGLKGFKVFNGLKGFKVFKGIKGFEGFQETVCFHFLKAGERVSPSTGSKSSGLNFLMGTGSRKVFLPKFQGLEV